MQVTASFGPERIEPEWWRGRTVGVSDEIGKTSREMRGGVRAEVCDNNIVGGGKDYFRIQDDRGRWLWMYRNVQTGRWFVHGQWA